MYTEHVEQAEEMRNGREEADERRDAKDRLKRKCFKSCIKDTIFNLLSVRINRNKAQYEEEDT